MATQRSSSAVRIAYSYAPGDRGIRAELGTFLAALRRREHVVEVDVGAPEIGAGRREAVRTALESCDILLLLLSADYVACDETWTWHLPVALETAARTGAQVVPIRVRPVSLEGLPVAELVSLPRFADSIQSISDRDAAFVEICDEVSRAISAIRARRRAIEESAASDDYRPARILLAFANPRVPGKDTNIGVGKECDELVATLSSGSRHFALRTLSGASRVSIAALLREHRPDLVHIGAHFSEHGLLLLEDTESNLADAVDPARVLELLTGELERPPRCLVLNTCHSLLFSLMAQSCIEHVVALWGRTPDAAARCYARGFYGAIARGESVAMAHDGGLVALRSSRLPRAAMPVYQRRNGASHSRHRL